MLESPVGITSIAVTRGDAKVGPLVRDACCQLKLPAAQEVALVIRRN